MDSMNGKDGFLCQNHQQKKPLPISPAEDPFIQYNKKIPPKTPPLALIRKNESVSPLISRESFFSLTNCNARHTLLYGKNNVLVGGDLVGAHNGDELFDKGYLSLVQDTSKILILKWTPNCLLTTTSNSRNSTDFSGNSQSSTVISTRLDLISQIHVHSTKESSEVVLIDFEGVPKFTFRFVEGVHCLCFLRVLAKSMEPMFRMEPSPWSKLDSNSSSKVSSPRFGLLNRWRWSSPSSSLDSTKSFSGVNNKTENGTTSGQSVNELIAEVELTISGDRVFHIFPNETALMNGKEHNAASKCYSVDTVRRLPQTHPTLQEQPFRDSLELAYKTVQRQLLSRSFHEWLKYCRNLQTIRSQLTGIVIGTIQEKERAESTSIVGEEVWTRCRFQRNEVLQVFFHGIEAPLRSKVWPYLLRLIDWSEDIDEMCLSRFRSSYLNDFNEWSDLESKINLSREQKTMKVPSVSVEEQKQKIPEENHVQSEQEIPSVDREDSILTSTCSDILSVDTNSDDKINDRTNNSSGFQEESPHESNMMEEFDINLNRIDKDVLRCDRNTDFYAKKENLDALRRIMCTYIYRQMKIDLEDGYVQGMCDLCAPLLVVFRDQEECLALACFEKLMERMRGNFPQSRHNGDIEKNLRNLRSMVEVMDPELFAQMMNDVDYTFVVFYRWLLLDFKRELTYNDVFKLWEIMWAAEQLITSNFQLFFGLALLMYYREIIIGNNMDFTEVIKFFNEMAEKHDVEELLHLARSKIFEFQKIVFRIDSK